jgi:hypothetical protein
VVVVTAPALRRESAQLQLGERLVAGGAALVLLVAALLVVVIPPDRQVALSNCANAAAGCVVSVDSDLTALATALAGVGAAVALVAILGIRFTTIKAGLVELGSKYGEETQGLPNAVPQGPNPPADTSIIAAEDAATVPVTVEVKHDVGTKLGVAPVAITRLTSPMAEVDRSFLRDYQSARRASQRSYFLTHILGPATQPGQKYSVALKLTPHREATDRVCSVSFYLGKSWGNQVFSGSRGSDGRFGIVTEAYGPFLALCEVEFADGSRIVLDHYCDFDMGSMLSA